MLWLGGRVLGWEIAIGEILRGRPKEEGSKSGAGHFFPVPERKKLSARTITSCFVLDG